MASFSNNLMQLVKQNKAFLVRGTTKNVTLVLEGKYFGLWTYDRSKRKVTYQFVDKHHLAEYSSVTHTADGYTTTQYPLPRWVYELFETKNTKFQNAKVRHPGILHKLNKNLSWAVTNWKRFKDKNSQAFQINFGTDIKQTVQLMFPNSDLSHISSETWEEVKKIQLGLYFIGIRRRYSVYKNLIKFGSLKKALRNSFRNMSGYVLNDFYSEHISKRQSVSIPFIVNLPKMTRNIPVNSYIHHLDMTTKTDHKAEQVVEKFYKAGKEKGNILCTSWRNYVTELNTAKNIGFVENWSMYDYMTLEQYNKRHETLVEFKRKFYSLQQEKKYQAVEAIHKKKWTGRDYPSWVRPLVTIADFQNEHKLMHHCIDTYFWQAQYMYFHVSLQEQATCMIDIENKRIIQLYSHCNMRVNEETRNTVQKFVDELKAP